MPGTDPPAKTRRTHASRGGIVDDATRQRNHNGSTRSVRSQARQAARYLGVADRCGRRVWVERDGLRSSLPYSGEAEETPYAWGRRGLGARELARAMLFDATGSIALAERFCRDLTHAVVARLPEREFTLGREDILAWLEHRH